jgi:hypothetical protein
VLLGNGLILQGGKDGALRLIGIQQMEAAGSRRGGELQTVSTPSGDALYTAPAVWRNADTTWVFVADNGGTAAWLLRDGLLQQQ